MPSYLGVRTIARLQYPLRLSSTNDSHTGISRGNARDVLGTQLSRNLATAASFAFTLTSSCSERWPFEDFLVCSVSSTDFTMVHCCNSWIPKKWGGGGI